MDKPSFRFPLGLYVTVVAGAYVGLDGLVVEQLGRPGDTTEAYRVALRDYPQAILFAREITRRAETDAERRGLLRIPKEGDICVVFPFGAEARKGVITQVYTTPGTDFEAGESRCRVRLASVPSLCLDAQTADVPWLEVRVVD